MLAPWLLLALPAAADIVYLKNGNTLEGVVTSQADGRVVVDLGYGETILNRADVSKITRTDRAAAQKTRRERRFEAGRDVPSEALSLDALTRKALSLREAALDARAHLRALDEERVEINSRRPAAVEDQRRLAQEVQAVGGNLNARPGIASRLNAASAAQNSDTLRLEQIGRQEDEERARIHGYLESAGKLKGLTADGDGPYYAWLRAKIKELSTDVISDSVSTESGKKNQLLVTALINGRVSGRFIVDTGASMTLLYRDIGKALALPPEAKLGTASATVADGRSVPTELVMLNSISVGKSKVEHVQAAIAPMSVTGIDGLLGMSFLSHFVTRVDAANGRLILEDIK